jgi:hypothetical protein
VKVHWGNLLVGFLLGAFLGAAVLGRVGIGTKAGGGM